MTRPNGMVLGAFMGPHGHNAYAWKHPDVDPTLVVNFSAYARSAQIAERGKFHLIFVADNAGVPTRDLDSGGAAGTLAHFEPITLLSAIAAVTAHIGLVSTATTSFYPPYLLARLFASLDHVSCGRAGWNVVTSTSETDAYNFGLDEHYDHDERYRRAEEFVDVVFGLWDSFEDDAFVYDKIAGQFFDPDKLHVLGHLGEFYKVRGPLNVPRPPQGRPVIVQAGQSSAGRALSARVAEVVFTVQPLLTEAQSFYVDIKSRMAEFGRNPDQLKILPGLFTVVGRTTSEAEAKWAQIRELISIDRALSNLSMLFPEMDLSSYDLDKPMPIYLSPERWTSRQKAVLEEAYSDGLTLREVAIRRACTRGHKMVVGSGVDVADVMQEWFEAEAADGFNVAPQILPDGLTDFVDFVIPELQRRRLFHTEYEGATLRENLGLTRPANVFASDPAPRR